MGSTMLRPDTARTIFKRGIEIIWLLIIFLIPVFFNPQSANVFGLNKALLFQFLVLTLMAFWVADWIVSRGDNMRLKWPGIFASPLHLSILIFGFTVAVATALSITPAISFWGSWYRKAGLLTLLCWILFFLILAQQLRNRTQILRAVYILLLSSAIVSIVGILQYTLPDLMLKVFPTRIEVEHRVVSTIGNPLFLSSFLAMVIPFNLALVAYSWSQRKEGNNVRIFIGLIILLALQFWCLWLAQYSITILLYIIAPIIFLILLGIARRKRILLGFGAMSLIVLGIIAGLLVIPLLFSRSSSGILTPSNETSQVQNLESTPISEELGLKTLDWRVQYWKSAVDIIIKSPEVPFSNDNLHNWRKLVGYGPETFTYTFQLFYPDKLKSMDTSSSTFVDRPHNGYLYLATTVGLLGLLSFLSILAIFFYLCFRYFRRTASDIDKIFIIAMVAAVLQYMADIFFNPSTIPPEMVFWLILAMTYAIGRLILNEQSAKPETLQVARTESGSPTLPRSRFFVAIGCALALIVIGIGITIRPYMADIYLNNGLKLINTPNDQPVYALDNLDKATRIYPEEDVYWNSLGAYSYYLARNVKGETARTELLTLATSADEKAREMNPYFTYRYLFLADTYTYWAETGAPDKWNTALSLYDQASQLSPRNAVIIDKWSLALIIKGDLDGARSKLGYAASIDPEWAETSFLSGLLLAKEGKNQEAAVDLTSPIREDPFNLYYFTDLNSTLKIYDLLSPLNNSLEVYAQAAPNDWAAHALLGTTSLFSDNLDKSINEFNAAMISVPEKDTSELFQAILRLSSMSQAFKTALPSVASGWRDKLTQSPDRDSLLPQLDQLTGNSE
jgi:hypothetical protein